MLKAITEHNIAIEKGGEEMRLSELIEEYIKSMIIESDEFVEFGRNELAEHFHCVPSQINYVISTRFNPERGYYVESRRGGGGNVKIKRIDITKDSYIMHLINSIKKSLSELGVIPRDINIFLDEVRKQNGLNSP